MAAVIQMTAVAAVIQMTAVAAAADGMAWLPMDAAAAVAGAAPVARIVAWVRMDAPAAPVAPIAEAVGLVDPEAPVARIPAVGGLVAAAAPVARIPALVGMAAAAQMAVEDCPARQNSIRVMPCVCMWAYLRDALARSEAPLSFRDGNSTGAPPHCRVLTGLATRWSKPDRGLIRGRHLRRRLGFERPE